MRKITSGSLFFAATLGLGACQRERDTEAETKPGPVESTIQPARTADADAVNVNTASVVSCQPSTDVTDAASRAIEIADANGDGKVSRDEAQAAMNFMLGGLFFRADANADGTVTPEEGRKSRDELTMRYPAFGTALAEAKRATGESPFRSLARVLDIDYGEALSLEQARKSARGALDEAFRLIDRNKDGAITRDEAVTASWEGARELGRNVFDSADGNKDHYLSSDEFQTAVSRSSRPLFDLADFDKDGRLSENEAAAVMSAMAGRLGVPAPSSGGPKGSKAPSSNSTPSGATNAGSPSGGAMNTVPPSGGPTNANRG